jgi:hypothetical protein
MAYAIFVDREQCVASAKVRIGTGREVSIQLKHFSRLGSSIQTAVSYDWSTTNIHFPIRFSDPRSTHVNSEWAVQLGSLAIASNISIAHNLAKSGQSAELPRQMCAKRQMNSQKAEKRILTSSQSVGEALVGSVRPKASSEIPHPGLITMWAHKQRFCAMNRRPSHFAFMSEWFKLIF